MNFNKRLHPVFAVLAAFFLFRAIASAVDPEMEKAFKLLNTAKEQIQSRSTPKTDPLPVVEAAQDALKKSPGDGRYHGHRVKAIESVGKAIAELKTGDRAHKALEYISQSISEIHAGGGLSK